MESWAALLRDLKARGLRPPHLVVGDGHLGIWGALTAVCPVARQQRC
jgi:putative transposase